MFKRATMKDGVTVQLAWGSNAPQALAYCYLNDPHLGDWQRVHVHRKHGITFDNVDVRFSDDEIIVQ